VLALPLSYELDRLDRLRNALAVYRLAFGQAARRTSSITCSAAWEPTAQRRSPQSSGSI
jgi:hypothetical protein